MFGGTSKFMLQNALARHTVPKAHSAAVAVVGRGGGETQHKPRSVQIVIQLE